VAEFYNGFLLPMVGIYRSGVNQVDKRLIEESDTKVPLGE
jgi:hypothetical protein